MSREIVVGVPEGANSSIATWLLKEQGYGVIGVTIQIWQDKDVEVREVEGGCYGLSAADDTRGVAVGLGIPRYVINLKEEFRKDVMDYFADGYVEERMPSPCITCNRHVKWGSLLRRSMAIRMDYITTGHYAQIDSLPGGCYPPKTLVATAKDQTCALYDLAQEQLSHTLMPVGGYHRGEIRDMVERLGLPVAHKPDSQGIYFIPDHNYASFTEGYTDRGLPLGDFMNLDGNVLGRHRSIAYYTIGRRKEPSLSMSRPIFVVEVRPETNEVVVSDNQDIPTNVFRYDKLSWMAVDGLRGKPMNILAKIRYSHKGSPCTIHGIGHDMVECRFHELVWAVTLGQAVASYNGDYVVGGGTIIRWNGR